MIERLDVREAQAHEIRKVQRARTGDVPQRVASHVAVVGGVGQFADADAIEHDPDDAVKARLSRTCRRILPRFKIRIGIRQIMHQPRSGPAIFSCYSRARFLRAAVR